MIIKGKDQGRLSPDDILAGLSGAQLDPDDLIEVSEVFHKWGSQSLMATRTCQVPNWMTTWPRHPVQNVLYWT
jgi:hypothetical protein